MKVTENYVFFWGGDDIYSNFHPCTFLYNGKKFTSSEQAFMFAKAVFFHDKDIAEQILMDSKPSVQKQLGRQVKGFDPDVWASVSEQVMYDVLYAKFTQNSILLEKLLSTEGKVLVEASPFDKIWGVGLGEDDPLILDEKNWKGDNKLGKCLTTLRDNLLGVHDDDMTDSNWH